MIFFLSLFLSFTILLCTIGCPTSLCRDRLGVAGDFTLFNPLTAHHQLAEAVTGGVGLDVTGIKDAPTPLPAALLGEVLSFTFTRAGMANLNDRTAFKLSTVSVALAGALNGLTETAQTDRALSAIGISMAEALIGRHTGTPGADLPLSAGAITIAFIGQLTLKDTEPFKTIHIGRTLIILHAIHRIFIKETEPIITEGAHRAILIRLTDLNLDKGAEAL